MNCAEFRNRLHALIEDRQPLDPAAAEGHLDGCEDAACRRQWQEALLLEQGLAEWCRRTPRVDVTEHVVAEWRAAAEQPNRIGSTATIAPHVTHAKPTRRDPARNRTSSGAWSAIAVAGVLCVSTLAFVLSTPGDPARVAHQQPAPSQPATHVRAVPAERELVAQSDPALQDMGRSYVGLMQNATFAVTDVVVLTLGGDRQLEEPSPAARWVHRWRDELHPVTDDVDDAVQKFLKTFPDSFPST